MGGAVPGNKMTREHLWSDWMAPYLLQSPEHHEFRATFSNGRQKVLRDVVRDRQGGAHTKKIKAVCAKCNGIWMSDMETKVQPSLIPLILGQPFVLSVDMQKVICEWIALKLLVVEHDSFGGHAADPIFPQSVRTEFMSSKTVPFGFRILAAAQIGEKWHTGFFSHTSTMTFSPTFPGPAPPKNGPRNVQAFCWGIGRIFFYVIATTNVELYHGLENFGVDHFATLWPPINKAIVWPPGLWFTDASLDKMPMALDNLAVYAGE